MQFHRKEEEADDKADDKVMHRDGYSTDVFTETKKMLIIK
jgi:hypothetical protein